jgi:hypothetical protein
VRVKVWGRFQQYPRTFIVGELGGNVFKRVGPGRLPIKKLWGPGIGSELIKDKSAEAFQATARELPARLLHELAFLMRV